VGQHQYSKGPGKVGETADTCNEVEIRDVKL